LLKKLIKRKKWKILNVKNSLGLPGLDGMKGNDGKPGMRGFDGPRGIKGEQGPSSVGERGEPG
jgi:hypothetical protein